MTTAFLMIHLFVALVLTVLVLVQHGKGADMGAAFGSGASGTVFGARGSANFLSRTTAVLATVFFATSLTLAHFAGHRAAPASVVDTHAPSMQSEGPAAPADDGQAPAPAQPATPPPGPAQQ